MAKKLERIRKTKRVTELLSMREGKANPELGIIVSPGYSVGAWARALRPETVVEDGKEENCPPIGCTRNSMTFHMVNKEKL